LIPTQRNFSYKYYECYFPKTENQGITNQSEEEFIGLFENPLVLPVGFSFNGKTIALLKSPAP